MSRLLQELSDRNDEFQNHLLLASNLDKRLLFGESVAIGEVTLTARHLMTIKSGLIVHLYNIIEAIMTRIIKEIGDAASQTRPVEWSDHTLKEWLRHYASTGIDGNEDSRLAVVHKAARKLLTHDSIEALIFKKPSGTWSDKLIYTFAKRLNVKFELNEIIARKLNDSAQYGDKSPLEFLAERRNAIAHGKRSFESGADDLTLRQIEDLSKVTLEYMQLAVTSFQAFIDRREFALIT